MPFYSKNILCFLATLLLSYGIASTAAAQQVPGTCDPDYYDLLGAKGYLEGKREMEAAQRIILKADSVLEYSCFHNDISWLGTYGGVFSENRLSSAITPPQFDGTPNPMLANHLDNALDRVVYSSLVGFLYSFRHVYGGGAYPFTPPSGACNPMNVVWHVAKCESFDPLTWVEMEDLANIDIRLYPYPCDDNGRDARIEAAYNLITTAPTNPPVNGSGTLLDWFTDDLVGDCNTSMAVPTGVSVTMQVGASSTTFEEAVCIKPKCAYDGSTPGPNSCQ